MISFMSIDASFNRKASIIDFWIFKAIYYFIFFTKPWSVIFPIWFKLIMVKFSDIFKKEL